MLHLRNMPILRSTALFLLVGTAASQLTFDAEDGTVLHKEFDANLLLELDEVSLSVDGNDMSEAIPLDSFELETTVHLVTSDEYREVDGGRPVRLVREFEELVLSYDAPDDQDSKHLDNIEGVQVLFEWNGEEGEYEASLTDDSEDIDSDFVGVLVEDMDFRALLPAEDISEGDSWEVAGGAVGGILLPGLRGEGVSELAAQEGDFPDAILEQLSDLPADLAMQCEYMGQREEEGKTVGVIEVTVEGSGSLELAEALGEEIEMGEGVTPEIDQATVELSLDGEGVLLWDIDAGHMVSFSIDAEIDIELVVAASVAVQGDSHEIEGSVVMVGDLEWSAEFSED